MMNYIKLFKHINLGHSDLVINNDYIYGYY